MWVLDKIENAFAGILFLAGMVVSLYAVFMRYIVGESQSWATEILTILLVWAIFIGFSTALRDDKHISIEILYDRFGPKMQKIAQTIVLLCGIFFSIFFIWTGTDMVLTAREQDIVTIDVGFPVWINYLIMPISGVLLLLRFGEKAYRFFVKKEDIVHSEEGAEWKH